LKPVSVDILRNKFYQDNWVWDSSTKGKHVMLSSNSRAAYFHTDPVLESTGTAGRLMNPLGQLFNKPFSEFLENASVHY